MLMDPEDHGGLKKSNGATEIQKDCAQTEKDIMLVS